MNKTYRKLKKLQALAAMVNENEHRKAKERQKETGWPSVYKEIMIEGIKNQSMPQIDIVRMEINYEGIGRPQSSWTDIPFDTLYESFTYLEEMKDDSHTEFSQVTSLIRHAAKVGFDGLKFGRYRRVFDSTDYLDFEVE